MRNVIKVGGIYRHYKGEIIKVLSVATHTETGEQMVCYVPYDRKGQKNRFWVRPARMFFDMIGDEPRFCFMPYYAEDMVIVATIPIREDDGNG